MEISDMEPFDCVSLNAVIKLHELHAVIYTRKSTASDGKSTADQERECRNWCDANKIHIAKRFRDEGKSASRYGTKHRDAWTELKAYLQPGHILVAWEASRATRDMAEGAALINLCAELGVPMAYNGRVLDPRSGDDRFVGGLDFLLAARESDQIRERVLRGKRGAALAGTPSSAPPWGYRAAARKPGGRPRWEIDPIEGPRLREAVLRVINGESLRGVLKWLQATGYAPATVTALRDCIKNPTIAGKRVHRGRVVGDATWEGIITETEHRDALDAARRPNTFKPGPEPLYLCSGIATCGNCGGKLAHKLSQHQKHVYLCPKGHVTRFIEMVDRPVERAVLRRLRNLNPNDYKTDHPETGAQRRIRDLETDLRQWKEKALAEEVSAEIYAAVEKDRLRKIADLRPQNIREKPMLTYATWPQGTMREKRETVRALLNVSVPPIKHLRRRATEGDVDITLK
jgi:DNA invertase Pin-like site-specific DNA recombinase